MSEIRRRESQSSYGSWDVNEAPEGPPGREWPWAIEFAWRLMPYVLGTTVLVALLYLSAAGLIAMGGGNVDCHVTMIKPLGSR
jgi:hypothetical protein